MRKFARTLSTVAITAGLVLGGGALTSASAAASGHPGTGKDAVHPLVLVGPFSDYDSCTFERRFHEERGFETTPCFVDPDGWYFQYF
jgi:hypothetical protein